MKLSLSSTSCGSGSARGGKISRWVRGGTRTESATTDRGRAGARRGRRGPAPLGVDTSTATEDPARRVSRRDPGHRDDPASTSPPGSRRSRQRREMSKTIADGGVPRASRASRASDRAACPRVQARTSTGEVCTSPGDLQNIVSRACERTPLRRESLWRQPRPREPRLSAETRRAFAFADSPVDIHRNARSGTRAFHRGPRVQRPFSNRTRQNFLPLNHHTPLLSRRLAEQSFAVRASRASRVAFPPSSHPLPTLFSHRRSPIFPLPANLSLAAMSFAGTP